jgi:hypothetical protein
MPARLGFSCDDAHWRNHINRVGKSQEVANVFAITFSPGMGADFYSNTRPGKHTKNDGKITILNG